MAASMKESAAGFCNILEKSEVTDRDSDLLKRHTALMTSVEKATNFLLLRDFDKCIVECRHGMTLTKQHAGDVHSMTRLLGMFAVMLIQAYAELNRWREVLPLITHEYQGIEDCPYQVIQLLVLLHAKVEEFAQCHAIASIWLKTEERRINNKDYKIVVETYLIHVLVQQNKWQDSILFLKSCVGLEKEDMQELLNYTNKLKVLSERNLKEERKEQKLKQRKQNRKAEVEGSSDPVSTVSHFVGDLMGFVRRFGCLVTSRMRYVKLSVIYKIIFVGVCVYLITLQATNGDLMMNSGRVFLIAQGMRRAIRSLLWPRSPPETNL